ncbi:MAG: hypothetical protein Q8P40_14055 [Nitrospirota bacterium]|nr:hypothetical protein [Nitrospirota bacterium]
MKVSPSLSTCDQEHFIFTCNDITSIIKPIKSLFEFKRIGEADIVEGLRRISTKEKCIIGDDVLRNIARKVDGDMRAAVNELLTDNFTVLNIEIERSLTVQTFILLKCNCSFHNLFHNLIHSPNRFSSV